jgi:hypothetical protein
MSSKVMGSVWSMISFSILATSSAPYICNSSGKSLAASSSFEGGAFAAVLLRGQVRVPEDGAPLVVVWWLGSRRIGGWNFRFKDSRMIGTGGGGSDLYGFLLEYGAGPGG